MKKLSFLLIGAAAFALSGGAEAKTFLTGSNSTADPFVYNCASTVTNIIDVGDEGQHTTTAVFGSAPGGGEGGEFDKTPILSTKVALTDGACLDAHLSALVGGPDFYGVSSMAFFQVTLTDLINGGPPVHMFGHYETPYGFPSPAVAMGAEPDVDNMGANFFEHVGTGKHDIKPSTYRVDVWWAGSPVGPGAGATGAAFVLKLYTRR
jgi:hypothetical protein